MSEGTVIGIICADLARFTNFTTSLVALEQQPNITYCWAQGVDIPGQCNEVCAYALEHGCDLWIMGDDHTFAPDTLKRLQAHAKDVVVPLCFKRYPPYNPVVYSYRDEDTGRHVPLRMPQEGGLVEVVAAGSAGMFIRHHVLAAMGGKWFESNGPNQNEDLTFCKKVREAGFSIWCDTDLPLGHTIIATVRPYRDETGWQTELELGNKFIVRLQRDDEIRQPTPGGEGALDVTEPEEVPVTIT